MLLNRVALFLGGSLIPISGETHAFVPCFVRRGFNLKSVPLRGSGSGFTSRE